MAVDEDRPDFVFYCVLSDSVRQFESRLDLKKQKHLLLIPSHEITRHLFLFELSFLLLLVLQQEEVSVVGEEAVELDGGPSPPPVLYQGPVFPPQAPSALPERVQASALGLNLHTDVLENRLVEW